MNADPLLVTDSRKGSVARRPGLRHNHSRSMVWITDGSSEVLRQQWLGSIGPTYLGSGAPLKFRMHRTLPPAQSTTIPG